MTLLKILLITILVLWAIRMLFRFLLPYLMSSFFGRMQQEAQKRYQQQKEDYFGKQEHQPDGKVRIDYVPPQGKRKRRVTVDKKVGEFVDFEEVKS